MQHKDIPDANLHETKGAASATLGQFLVAQGDGTAEFQTKLFKLQASLTPTAVGANDTSVQSFTVSGLLVASDIILACIKPTNQSGLVVGNVLVTANNTCSIQFANITGSSITPTAAETYTFIVYRG